MTVRLRPGPGRGLGLAALRALAAGCAGTRAGRATPAAAAPAAAAEKPADLTFAPEEVRVSALDLELSEKNDEELFALATAAYGAGDYTRAAAAFARVVDRFPGSRHEAAALFDAGLAYEKLEAWRLALERFRDLARRYTGPDALEAAFKAAECLYNLHELDDTHAALAAIAARPELPLSEKVRVQTQLGVVEAEQGQLDQAETTLRRALSTWQAAGDKERLDPYYAAQAQYYVGEIYREWFRALPFDPSTGDDAQLAAALERKSEMLLSAQGHYLRTIRLGNETWAVAAAFRVGELYDELRRQLLDAPLPPGLDDEHAAEYRKQLRGRVRILATKAISAWEAALSWANRTGFEDQRYLASAQDGLARLKEALAEDASRGI